MGFLSVLAFFAVSAYIVHRIEVGRSDPHWVPSPAFRLATIVVTVAWQLLRAWYVVVGALFGVVCLVAAERLYDDGTTFESVAFGIVGTLALSASFWWFAVNTQWRIPEPMPTLAELDENTLGSLMDAGVDVTQPVSIGFYLYFTSEEAAHRAADTGTTPMLEARVGPFGDGVWRCEFMGTFVPSLSTMRDNTTRLDAIATSLGGEYDGWVLADNGAPDAPPSDPT